MNNKKEYYVYEWIRLDTLSPFYVGKGKGDRAYQIKKNKYFQDILKYCDKNNVEVVVSILQDNLTEEEAFEVECWYIGEYVCMGFELTNMTWGGEGGNAFSRMSKEQQEEYRQKMRKACLGKNKGRKHTEEAKQLMSEKKKGKYTGEKNPMYGKDVTKFMDKESILKWKQNIGASHRGMKRSESTKQKISMALTGRTFSEEHKKHLSESRTGKGNHRYGIKLDDKQKDLLRKARIKKTIFVLNEEYKEFDSRNECIDYVIQTYGVSMWFCKQLIKTGKAYKATQKKHIPLNGMRIYYKDQGGDIQ